MDGQSGARGAYLRRRGHGATRVLENEAELEELLTAEGFLVVDPQAESLSSLWQKLAGAPIVVGVEGSHLAHGLFTMRDRGALVCIQPPRRFNNVFKDYTDCLGLTYGFVLAEESAGGFQLRGEDLMSTIELVERSQRA